MLFIWLWCDLHPACSSSYWLYHWAVVQDEPSQRCWCTHPRPCAGLWWPWTWTESPPRCSDHIWLAPKRHCGLHFCTQLQVSVSKTQKKDVRKSAADTNKWSVSSSTIQLLITTQIQANLQKYIYATNERNTYLKCVLLPLICNFLQSLKIFKDPLKYFNYELRKHYLTLKDML